MISDSTGLWAGYLYDDFVAYHLLVTFRPSNGILYDKTVAVCRHELTKHINMSAYELCVSIGCIPSYLCLDYEKLSKCVAPFL